MYRFCLLDDRFTRRARRFPTRAATRGGALSTGGDRHRRDGDHSHHGGRRRCRRAGLPRPRRASSQGAARRTSRPTCATPLHAPRRRGLTLRRLKLSRPSRFSQYKLWISHAALPVSRPSASWFATSTADRPPKESVEFRGIQLVKTSGIRHLLGPVGVEGHADPVPREATAGGPVDGQPYSRNRWIRRSMCPSDRSKVSARVPSS